MKLVGFSNINLFIDENEARMKLVIFEKFSSVIDGLMKIFFLSEVWKRMIDVCELREISTY